MSNLYEQTVKQNARAVHIFFAEGRLCTILSDGRLIGVPIAWYSRLTSATEAQRNNRRFTANGEGIHWEEVDEDISVESMLLYSPENDI